MTCSSHAPCNCRRSRLPQPAQGWYTMCHSSRSNATALASSVLVQRHDMRARLFESEWESGECPGICNSPVASREQGIRVVDIRLKRTHAKNVWAPEIRCDRHSSFTTARQRRQPLLDAAAAVHAHHVPPMGASQRPPPHTRAHVAHVSGMNLTVCRHHTSPLLLSVLYGIKEYI